MSPSVALLRIACRSGWERMLDELKNGVALSRESRAISCAPLKLPARGMSMFTRFRAARRYRRRPWPQPRQQPPQREVPPRGWPRPAFRSRSTSSIAEAGIATDIADDGAPAVLADLAQSAREPSLKATTL